MFEVNSSSERSRGPLLATLKEATLSHQVSTHLHSPRSIFSFFTRNGHQRDATLASSSGEAADGVKERKREGGERRKESERGEDTREEKGAKDRKGKGGRLRERGRRKVIEEEKKGKREGGRPMEGTKKEIEKEKETRRRTESELTPAFFWWPVCPTFLSS